MLIVDSYAVAVGLCFVTMLCWGSWANTLKLASKEWPFPLYYWDYAIGLVLTSLVLGLTIGSMGSEGRAFVADLRQASGGALTSAFARRRRVQHREPPRRGRHRRGGPGRGLPGRDRPRPGGRGGRELRGHPPGQPRPPLHGGGARGGGDPRGRAGLCEAALGEGGDRQGPRPLRHRRPPDGILLPVRGGVDDHATSGTPSRGGSPPSPRCSSSASASCCRTSSGTRSSCIDR